MRQRMYATGTKWNNHNGDSMDDTATANALREEQARQKQILSEIEAAQAEIDRLREDLEPGPEPEPEQHESSSDPPGLARTLTQAVFDRLCAPSACVPWLLLVVSRI